MTARYDWPLPFLIQPDGFGEIQFDPLPQQRTLRDDVAGVGSVEMRLGGPDWDVLAGRADSVADRLADGWSGVLLSPKEILPDLIQLSGALPIASERLVEVVEPLLRQYELIPLRLRRKNTALGQPGRPIEQRFFWLNTWNRLDLVDLTGSVFTPQNALCDAEGRVLKIAGWQSLALKPGWPCDEHLFGIEQFSNQWRFCSVDFYERCRASGLDINFRPMPLDRGAGVNQRMASYHRMLSGPKIDFGDLQAPRHMDRSVSPPVADLS